MPTSSLTVSVDQPEYSPYYDPLHIITAFVSTVGTDPASTVTITLIREDGYGIVLTVNKPLTIVSGAGTAQVQLDLTTAYDADAIFRAILGKYHVQAKASDSSVTANSETFRITPTPVQEMKDTLLRGIDMISSEVIRVQRQPVLVTGATVGNVSTTQRRDIFPLVFTNTGPTLSWDSGTAVTVSRVGRHTYTLVSSDESSWIEVTVQGELLPTSDKTESLIMDLDRIKDEDLMTLADRAYGQLQGRINTKLEPREVNTDNVGSVLYNSSEYVDEWMTPVSYYKVDWARKWFYVKFPTNNILKVWRLDGFFQSSRALTVDISQWLTMNKKGGEVEFVPKYGAILSFQFYGVPFFAYMHQFDFIPSFWHYRLTVGLEDLKNSVDRARVREALLRWAAMDALILAGTASAPGLIGESTARDGVSESRSYAQGPGGRYANIVTMHKEFLFGVDGFSGEVKRLRDKFTGVMMVVL